MQNYTITSTISNRCGTQWKTDFESFVRGCKGERINSKIFIIGIAIRKASKKICLLSNKTTESGCKMYVHCASINCYHIHYALFAEKFVFSAAAARYHQLCSRILWLHEKYVLRESSNLLGIDWDINNRLRRWRSSTETEVFLKASKSKRWIQPLLSEFQLQFEAHGLLGTRNIKTFPKDFELNKASFQNPPWQLSRNDLQEYQVKDWENFHEY